MSQCGHAWWKKLQNNVALKNCPNVIENYQMYRRMSESQESHIFVTFVKNAMYISCTFRAVASKENISFIFLSLFVILWTFHFQYPITKDIKYKYILQDDMSTIKFSLFLKPLTGWFLANMQHMMWPSSRWVSWEPTLTHEYYSEWEKSTWN